jgi:hypothetical protein
MKRRPDITMQKKKNSSALSFMEEISEKRRLENSVDMIFTDFKETS